MKHKVVIDALKDFIQKRATRVSRPKLVNVLVKVPYAEPKNYDRLPSSIIGKGRTVKRK